MRLQAVRRLSFVLGMLLFIAVIVTSLDVFKGRSDLSSLGRGNPKGVNMDKEQLKQIDYIMKRAIDDGVFPGGIVLVVHKESVAYEKAFGYADLYVDDLKTPSTKPIRVRTGTIFDVASISKLFTATAVMQLVEKKKIALDDPVALYLPSFKTNGKEKVTIRQLLSHTSGLPASIPLHQVPGDKQARIDAALQARLIAEPGTKMIYSDLGYIILGELVQNVSGMPLDQYMDKHIFQPLHMKSTMYRPPYYLKKRIASTEFQRKNQRGLVWGEVHDENAWALGGVVGHAGLFSTAEDLGRFALAHLNQGQLHGHRILQADTVQEMTRIQTPHIADAFRGLGWELNQDWYMGSFAGTETFGHTGFTGSSLFIDRQREVIVIILTNRVHPTRTGPNVSEVRKEIANAVFRSMMDK